MAHSDHFPQITLFFGTPCSSQNLQSLYNKEIFDLLPEKKFENTTLKFREKAFLCFEC